MSLYIGLMSGTSADGMDAALIDVGTSTKLIDALCIPYSPSFQSKLRTLALESTINVLELMLTKRELAQHAVNAIQQLLDRNQLSFEQIVAIGSHGHTLRHQPQPNGFSWQINDPAWIAEHTKITCVADFRRRDIAAGGEGAPLVPAFHADCFPNNSMVLNIGGISNLTLLSDNPELILGFDSGPGNALIDEWCQRHFDCPYDKNGELASQGRVIQPLLDVWLSAPYFQQHPPKSTGRELFQLSSMGNLNDYSALDVIATLTELTAQSIAHAVAQFSRNQPELYVCGGGVHNQYLMGRIQSLLPSTAVRSTAHKGIDPDWLEAMAFGWLAARTINNKCGNLASATGASGARILGAIYPA